MNFNRNIPCAGNTSADRNIIDKRFNHFTAQMFRICVPLDKLAAITADFNFFIEFG